MCPGHPPVNSSSSHSLYLLLQPLLFLFPENRDLDGTELGASLRPAIARVWLCNELRALSLGSSSIPSAKARPSVSLPGGGCVEGPPQGDELASNFLGNLVLRDFWKVYANA